MHRSLHLRFISGASLDVRPRARAADGGGTLLLTYGVNDCEVSELASLLLMNDDDAASWAWYM